jgi:hypothetical protein
MVDCSGMNSVVYLPRKKSLSWAIALEYWSAAFIDRDCLDDWFLYTSHGHCGGLFDSR